MKFINYLESISGISIYPMVSFGIFFIFFLILLTWVFTAKKSHFEEAKNIPLDNGK